VPSGPCGVPGAGQRFPSRSERHRGRSLQAIGAAESEDGSHHDRDRYEADRRQLGGAGAAGRRSAGSHETKVLQRPAIAVLLAATGTGERRKMSETHKRRGTWPAAAGRPWSEEELALLRSLTPKEVVKRTDRTYSAVTAMRFILGLRRGRKRRRRTEAAKAPRRASGSSDERAVSTASA
jgi:hypothetical protein